MSHLRRTLLQMLYDGWQVRFAYVDLLKSVVEMEHETHNSYDFFDGERKRRGIVYQIGRDEVFWFRPEDDAPAQLFIPSQRLRENLLDMLACHPLYAKWFGH